MAYGAIAQVAGGVMQAIAARIAQEKMLKEYKKERERQKAYAGEATGVFQERLGSADVDTARSQMEEGRTARLADFAGVARNNLAPTLNLQMTPQDRAAFDVSTRSRAKFGSYSDWAMKQAIQDIRTQQELNRITSFAGGTASVFPYREYAAQHSQDWLATMGALLSSVGGSAPAFANMYGSPSTAGWQQQQDNARMNAPSFYEGDVNSPGWAGGQV